MSKPVSKLDKVVVGLTLDQYLEMNPSKYQSMYYYHPDMPCVEYILIAMSIISIILVVIMLIKKFRKKKVSKKMNVISIMFCIITIVSHFIKIPK